VVAEGLPRGPHRIEVMRDDDPARTTSPLRVLGLAGIGVTG
jgi:hypothetical protein